MKIDNGDYVIGKVQEHHLAEHVKGISPKFTVLASLKWTTTPPTEEGQYWAQHEVANEIMIVQVFKLEENYLSTDAGPLFVFTHWLGPLPVPAPPEKASKVNNE